MAKKKIKMNNLFNMAYVCMDSNEDVYVSDKPYDNDKIIAHGTYSELYDFADNVLSHCDEPLAELIIEKVDEYFG